jgi:hypothetical protein
MIEEAEKWRYYPGSTIRRTGKFGNQLCIVIVNLLWSALMM